MRQVAKLDKFKDNTTETLGRSHWDVQQLSAAIAAELITCTRGEVATLVRRLLSVSLGDGLQAWHAVTQWFKPRSVVLVEHESKFSEVVADSVKTAAMRAMLPKDVLERFLDGPLIYEELRKRVSAHVEEKAGRT